MTTTAASKPPSVSVDQVAVLAGKLRGELSDFTGAPLEGPHLNSLCKRAAIVLGCSKREETIRAALLGYWGKPLESDDYKRLSYYLAGNIHMIRKGISPRPWDSSSPTEWMLASIVGIRAGRKVMTRDAEPEAVLRLGFRVAVGTLTPGLIVAYWRRRQAPFFSKFLGFRRKDPTEIMLYDDFPQYVGLRVAVLLDPNKYDARRAPTVIRFNATSGLKKYNQNLIRERSRDPMVTQYRCPFSYAHPCHRCTKGWNECPVAMRARTLYLAPCKHCYKAETLFDDDEMFGSTSFCVACQHKELLT